MKSLTTIQKLAKLGKILSTLIFVLSVFFFCFNTFQLVVFSIKGSAVLSNGAGLGGFTSTESSMTLNSGYGTLAIFLIVRAGDAVLAKFAAHYFKRELADGTPFTKGGADELKRLGLLTLCITLGVLIISRIIYTVMVAPAIENATSPQINRRSNVAFGIMFLVMSAILRYGAEMCEGRQLRKA